MDEYPLNRSEPDTSVNAGRLHGSDPRPGQGTGTSASRRNAQCGRRIPRHERVLVTDPRAGDFGVTQSRG